MFYCFSLYFSISSISLFNNLSQASRPYKIAGARQVSNFSFSCQCIYFVTYLVNIFLYFLHTTFQISFCVHGDPQVRICFQSLLLYLTAAILLLSHFFLFLISLSYFSLFSFHTYFFFYIFISQQSLRVFPFSHVLLLLFCSYDVHEHWHSYFYFPMSVFYFITYVVDCCIICVAHDWAVSCAMFTHLFNLYIVFVSPAKCCLAI